MLTRMSLLTLLLALAACGADYRPGVSGQYPTLLQNAPSNAMPQPAGSLNR